MTRTPFLDLDFDCWTIERTLAWIAARGAGSAFAYLVTPNVDHLVRLANAPPEIVDAYRAADLIVCDSRVLARLARTMGIALTVVPGSDVVARLFAEVLKDGDRVCVIGSSPDEVRLLGLRYPALDIRHHDASHGLRTDSAARAACVRFAAEADARVTLIAVGSPQQELVAREMQADGGPGGTALCIGAAVDFITGAQRRAPRLVQRVGMEWAWRLVRDPRRLARRYLVEGPAIFGLALRWRRRTARR